MPDMHQVIHFANRAFMPDVVDDFDLAPADDLPEESNFADALEALDLATAPATLEFIANWPRGQLAAVGAAVRDALAREPRAGITFAWAPGYDYEITIWESEGMPGMRAEMTILFRSQYPAGHPSMLARKAPAAPKSVARPPRRKTAANRAAKKTAPTRARSR